ncbi:MAG TPA: pirin family protein [Burkholderiales bacterium]|nr:pirin family protein [Burkholderiales bacterium]
MDVLKSHDRDLGGGLTVSRVLPGHPHQMVGPFIFFDQMGPVTVAAEQNVDVRPHPHIGLATVTWLFEGELIHRDSLGTVQPIAPGDVNWMTAGRGIVHSERGDPAARKSTRRMYGIQSWVALPKDHENAEPAFSHHPAATLPKIRMPGVDLRLIAGNAFGEQSPAPTFSKMFYVAAELEAGATLTLPPEHEERGVYLVQGSVAVDGNLLPGKNLAYLPEGKPIQILANTRSRAMLLGGGKMDGPRHIWWNFVASSKEKIEDAKQRWRERRFEAVPGETEFIPLPER